MSQLRADVDEAVELAVKTLVWAKAAVANAFGTDG
jgi:hypothetical protein